MRDAVADSGSGLTDIVGVGPMVAARLLGRTGRASRFPTSAAFAVYAGVAPIEIASANKARHRLSREGDRKLNNALHTIALTAQHGSDRHTEILAPGLSPRIGGHTDAPRQRNPRSGLLVVYEAVRAVRCASADGRSAGGSGFVPSNTGWMRAWTDHAPVEVSDHGKSSRGEVGSREVGVSAVLRAQRLAGNRATVGLLEVQRDASGVVTVQRSPLSAEEIAGLTLPQVEARIAENEAEAAPLVISAEHLAVLSAEHIRLSRRYEELTHGRRTSTDGTGDRTAALLAVELSEVEALVRRLAVDVPARPRDHALNAVRGVAQRLRTDQEFLEALAGRGGAVAAASARIARLIALFAPVVAGAEQWHTANPAGDSLGMMNEATGTWLAGRALDHWDRGGWYYVSGAAAFVAAGAVALVEAGEQLLSMGFHEAATEVSRAYTRGDISWNEGESILTSAAWRALLTAAVTRGAGAAASRLGGAAASGAGFATRSVGYGLVGGAVAGGVGAAASLGTQSLLTALLQDHFSGGVARSIWRQGIPSGGQWAVAIPVAMLLGAGAGARAVRLGNAELIGSTVDLPEGRFRILAITPEGQVVLAPVGLRSTPPPPPPAVIEMVFDANTGYWEAAGSGARPASTSGPATLAGPSTRGSAPAAAPPQPPVPALPRGLPAPGGTSAAPAPGPLAATGPTATTGPATTGPAVAVEPAAADAPPATTGPIATTGPAATGPTAAVAPTAATPPVTARTAAADRRVAETEAALATATSEVALARTRVATAETDLHTAQAGGVPAAVRAAEANLRRARNALDREVEGEATARREATAAQRGRGEIVRTETEIARLTREVFLELNPPGGFTAAQVRAGRRPNVIPPVGQAIGVRYHELAAQLRRNQQLLASEVAGLTRSLADQVAAATPGAAARPVALANAAALAPALHPVGTVPIDVTTGAAMTSTRWSTDHLMPRTEIARDPRFARLTPPQRNSMLLDVPENYLPLPYGVNSEKNNRTIEEWIAWRAAAGRPLPQAVADALRAADVRARAAIEAMFNRFLPPE